MDTELRKTLVDIITPPYGEVCIPTPQGPNNWDNMTSEDFGPEHDFILENHGSIWIFDPVSNAALQWCYRFLPSDAPRWGHKGYAIEARFIEDIVKGARECNLMSTDDYANAMEESHQQSLQGEER